MLARARRLGAKLPRPRELTLFLRQLALLVGAGLTLEAALATLSDDASKPLATFATGQRPAQGAGARDGEISFAAPQRLGAVLTGSRRQVFIARIGAATPLFGDGRKT